MIRQKPQQIRKLEYRSPRLASATTIVFAVNGDSLLGYCKDVSESGLRARFEQPLAVGISGSLTLHYRDGAVTRRARVAYVDDRTVGLTFLPDEPAGPSLAIVLVRRTITGD